MAMLAGPRRKQKVINLRANNNAWSNDTNKFGQRMLEKMGWSAGKGLGAKENGIVEHVVARYKNDDSGLGFKDKNDQWTKHEDDFNALLANLSNGDDNKESLHSGISLEVKSKKSKARIHYHKFTRGKDISRYSEKDLANIFGKKSFKETEEEETIKEDATTSEHIFTEKGNMDDYFKNKMAAIKSKLFDVENKVTQEEEISDFVFQGFSNTNDNQSDKEDKNYQSFYDSKTNILSTDELPHSDMEIKKSMKKKKKKKSQCKDVTEDNSPSSELLQSRENVVNNEILTKKKSKKKKNETQMEEEEAQEHSKSKKKKKDKKEHNYVQEENIDSCDDYVPKKKKKRKQKDV
ncbi:unnamed protein product, partial [Brenthis ino]